jgi:hypothetical protein
MFTKGEINMSQDNSSLLALSLQGSKMFMIRYYPCSTQKQCPGKDKGKAIPLQAWTDPESSRRSRLPYFKTVGT